MSDKVTLTVSLVVDHWRGSKGVRLKPKDDMRLSSGDLHAGSTFPATITLDADTAKELQKALEMQYQPVFWMRRGSDDQEG